MSLAVAPSILPPVLGVIGPWGIDDLDPVLQRILGLVFRVLLLLLGLLLRFFLLLLALLILVVLRERQKRDAQHPQRRDERSSTEGTFHNGPLWRT